MKTKLKKIIILALTMFLLIGLVTGVEASGILAGALASGTSSSSESSTNANKVKEWFKGGTNPEGNAAIKNIISAVLSVVRTAGATVAIVMLMTIAAKYIMASAGDRADIKKYAVNYVIGAIILFGTTGILGIVQNFIQKSLE